ncbi:MAG: signal peptide peptidase SppA [Sphingomonadales bacterium]|nr:signal peptide peptidase SppA [Sphingomonadales bacterium]
MLFARKVWKLLVAVKDGLALLFLLLFFVVLYAAMTGRPSAGVVREGALLLKLDGAVVEEPAEADPLDALLSRSAPVKQYRARDVVRALRTAAKDDRIKAVVLDLSRFTGGGLVHMQEIGAALDTVRAAKKPVLTWAVGYADDSVMLAAHSTEVWVDPLGGAFVLGPGGNNLYYGKLIERLKVTAHVYRVGTYKDFVEPYLRNDQSQPSREAKQALYGAIWEQWQADVTKARPKAQLARVTSDPVGWLKASGGNAAEAARAAGLVDRIGDSVEFGKRVAELAGKDSASTLPGAYAHTSLKAWLGSNPADSSGKSIGVVTIAGEIVDGKAGPGVAGGDRIARALDEALDKDLAGLVVRVDSPGGSVMASEAIRSAILRHKAKGIPVAVSMANMAASGGYWVSTPGQRIFAEPGTVTGSIGIFAVIPSFEKALAEWGVNGDGVRTTALSGQPDVMSGLTPEVEAMLQANIESGYARFVGLVAKSRGKTPEQIDAIAQGRVWDGGTARQNGLVDQFGGLDDALAWTAKQAKLGDGDWHAEFLGAQETPYANLLQGLTGDNDDAESARGGSDAFALIAQRQQAQAVRAVERFGRLFGTAGAQAYCLECPAPAGTVPAKDKLGMLAQLARWLGLS